MVNLSLFELLTVFLVSAGILSGIIISVLLVIEASDNRKANTALAALIFLSSLTILELMISLTGLPNNNNALYFLPLRFTLVIGPLLYFYVRFSLLPSQRFRWFDALHFVLPLLQAGFYLWVGFRGAAYKTRVWLNIIRPYGQWEDHLFTFGLPLYVLLAFLVIRAYKKANPGEHQQIRWMNRLLLIIGFALIINTFYELIDYSFLFGLNSGNCCPDWFWDLEIILFALLILWIAFNGYLHIHFMRLSHAQPQVPDKPKRKETYNLENDTIQTLGDKLELLMSTERPYLNPDLNLASLADELAVSAKVLSLVINETKAKSYSDYINDYRIEHVKSQLMNPEAKQHSLLDIAFDAGFNSKATFNRVFKQLTGLTPSQFRSQN